MNNGIDTIRKVVAIIAGTLAIILMVFGLCKKVGLCADAGFSLPYYTANKTIPDNVDIDIVEGFIKSSSGVTDWENTTNKIIGKYSEDNNMAYYDYYIIYGETQEFYITTSNYSVVISPAQANSINNDNNRIYLQTKGANLIERYRVSYNMDTEQIINNGRQGQFSIWTLPTPDTNQIIYYVNNDINYTSQDINSSTPSPAPNALIFSKGEPSPPHSKGGVLAEITENNDIAETELPQIDTEAPTDTTSSPAWYQKILNAIGKIGLNIQSNTITTGNYLEQILTGQRNFFTDFLAVLGTHIGDITDRLDTIIGYDRENQASTLKDDWIAGYNNSDIKAITVTGQNMKTTLSNIGSTNTGNLVFGPWRLTYISGHLHLVGNYTMPEIFGGGTHQQDISFEWYENIRSWFVNIFKVFLFVGFAWYLVTQVPNMLHGTSGVFEKGRKEK